MSTETSSNNFFSLPSMEDIVSYCFVLISIFFMIYQLPGITSNLSNPVLHQTWNSIFQLGFCLFGYLSVRKYYFIASKNFDNTGNLKEAIKDEIKREPNPSRIKQAFPFYAHPDDSDDTITRAYSTALSTSYQTLKEIRLIWLAWSAFYIVSIAKNAYYRALLTEAENISPFFYYFDTLETFCSSIVYAFSFSIYFKLNTLKQNNEMSISRIWSFIIGLSLVHIFLLNIRTINPLEVNWAFQVIGSTISGVSLVLLFSKLCDKAVNPRSFFLVVFVLYAVLQPLIFLHQTEAVILRMPEGVRLSTIKETISNAAYKAIDSLNITLSQPVLALDTMSSRSMRDSIESDISWLKDSANRKNLEESFNSVDFEPKAFREHLDISPLSIITKEKLYNSLKDQRVYLFAQDSMLTYAIIRRWYLLFGKAWFLIYIGWLYRKGRILKYFMSHDKIRLEEEMAKFDEHKSNLPMTHFFKLH